MGATNALGFSPRSGGAFLWARKRPAKDKVSSSAPCRQFLHTTDKCSLTRLSLKTGTHFAFNRGQHLRENQMGIVRGASASPRPVRCAANASGLSSWPNVALVSGSEDCFASAGPFFCLSSTKLRRITDEMDGHNWFSQTRAVKIMNAPYRPEQLIRADRGTAEINLAVLRSQAASEGQGLTNDQSRAAIRIALKLGILVREHAPRKTLPVEKRVAPAIRAPAKTLRPVKTLRPFM